MVSQNLKIYKLPTYNESGSNKIVVEKGKPASEDIFIISLLDGNRIDNTMRTPPLPLPRWI